MSLKLDYIFRLFENSYDLIFINKLVDICPILKKHKHYYYIHSLYKRNYDIYRPRKCIDHIIKRKKLSEKNIGEIYTNILKVCFRSSECISLLFMYQKMSESFMINTFTHGEIRSNYEAIFFNQNVSEKFLRKYLPEIYYNCIENINDILKNLGHSENIHEYIEKNMNNIITEESIIKNKNKLKKKDKRILCRHKKMNEKTLIELDTINESPSWIINYQDVSENFISNNINKITETCLSFHQILSEKFIRENENYFYHFMSWRYLFYNQELSQEFIDEFSHKTEIR